MWPQVGGNAKRPRLEGPSGPLARLPTKNTSSFILLNGSAPDPRDADDSDGGGGGYGGGGGGARRRPLSSGLPPLKVTPVGGMLAAPGSPDHHPPSSHRPHLLGHHSSHHHHHGHGGGQHGMSLLGSSPRGVKMPQHRAPGGAFGTLMEDFEPEPHEGAPGGGNLAKAVQRTHGIGKASATFCASFIPSDALICLMEITRWLTALDRHLVTGPIAVLCSFGSESAGTICLRRSTAA